MKKTKKKKKKKLLRVLMNSGTLVAWVSALVCMGVDACNPHVAPWCDDGEQCAITCFASPVWVTLLRHFYIYMHHLCGRKR
jgi:hypothetical protein